MFLQPLHHLQLPKQCNKNLLKEVITGQQSKNSFRTGLLLLFSYLLVEPWVTSAQFQPKLNKFCVPVDIQISWQVRYCRVMKSFFVCLQIG